MKIELLALLAIGAMIAGVLLCPLHALGATAAQQDLIEAVYMDLLHRPADAQGLSTFSALLDAGGTDYQVAHAVDTSREYYTGLVKSYYQTYLHRLADSLDLENFVPLLENGGKDQAVQASLLGSDEYFEKRGRGTNAGFLNALYLDLLGRPVDPGGLSTLERSLAQGASRAQVASMLLQSPEYNSELVKSYYERFLHREPDSLGLTFYLAELHDSLADETVIAQILGTAEFLQDANATNTVTTCDERSLRAALAGSRKVTFNCSGTIAVKATLNISRNTTIDGIGQNVTISGGDTVQVISISHGVTLSLNQVNIANGSSSGGSNGGGIYNLGTLNITNSTLSGSAAVGGAGGGIYNAHGTVSVIGSTLTANQAVGGGASGGNGGGIYNAGGVVIVTDSTLSGNTAADSGGGIYNNAGQVTLKNSIFTNNAAIGGDGGGIESQGGTLVIVNSTVCRACVASSGGVSANMTRGR